MRLLPGVVGPAMLCLACVASSARARADVAPATSPSESPRSTPSAAAAPPVATTEAAPASSKRTVWPWIIMGTGVALVVTATVLEVNAVGEDDKRTSEEVKLTSYVNRPASDAEKKALQASVDDHAKSASNERTAALIVGTVGFLAIAGSVVLWFFEGSSRSPAPAATLRPSLVPSFGPSYAGATLGASF